MAAAKLAGCHFVGSLVWCRNQSRVVDALTAKTRLIRVCVGHLFWIGIAPDTRACPLLRRRQGKSASRKRTSFRASQAAQEHHRRSGQAKTHPVRARASPSFSCPFRGISPASGCSRQAGPVSVMTTAIQRAERSALKAVRDDRRVPFTLRAIPESFTLRISDWHDPV